MQGCALDENRFLAPHGQDQCCHLHSVVAVGFDHAAGCLGGLTARNVQHTVLIGCLQPELFQQGNGADGPVRFLVRCVFGARNTATARQCKQSGHRRDEVVGMSKVQSDLRSVGFRGKDTVTHHQSKRFQVFG